MEEIKSILLSLLKNNESENVEYKEAKNNFDFNELGRYFSALSNGANLIGKQYAWLVFGVTDKTHEFINTNYRRNSNLNGLKKELTQSTNDNLTFLDIYELEIDDNRVIMFKIPAAIGVPTTWKGIAYDRNDDALIPLNDTKRNTILSTVNIDWSRQIVEGLTVDDLDKDAILKAREQFKKKNENKAIAEEIDNMDDLTFLNKAYSKLLLENTELSLVEVMLLDRVQKNIVITKEQSDYLRKNKLVEGRYPNIYVSKGISEIVNEKVAYTKKSGFDDQYYKDLVLKHINNWGNITKKELDELLMNKLPESLNTDQKKRKIKYLVNETLAQKENKIENIGNNAKPIWALKK